MRCVGKVQFPSYVLASLFLCDSKYAEILEMVSGSYKISSIVWKNNATGTKAVCEPMQSIDEGSGVESNELLEVYGPRDSWDGFGRL